MVKRRKFLTALGATAAGGAAAMGTGAFTSVEANRNLKVQVASDASALLALDTVEGSANSEYVSVGGDNTIAIDISTTEGVGLNNHAKTIIENLFQVRNQGTQPVYAWASGLPTNPRVAFGVGSSSQIQNNGTGQGQNQGAFSTNSNLNPNDIDDDQTGAATAPPGESSDTGGEEAAPLLNVGDFVNVEAFAYGDLSGLDFDDSITIHAVSEDEIGQREGE